MAAQAFVHQFRKRLAVFGQQTGALGKGDALGAVAAVVGHVAGGLVGEQIDGNAVLVDRVFQQIDDVAVVGDGKGPAGLSRPAAHGKGFIRSADDTIHPALGGGSRCGFIHLGDDGNRPGNLGRLGLRAAHAPQARGDEQAAGQVGRPCPPRTLIGRRSAGCCRCRARCPGDRCTSSRRRSSGRRRRRPSGRRSPSRRGCRKDPP
jgi:hypothetical protein